MLSEVLDAKFLNDIDNNKYKKMTDSEKKEDFEKEIRSTARFFIYQFLALNCIFAIPYLSYDHSKPIECGIPLV